ncbi:hypothetical protein MYP_3017 [Sporocytophaga myxococcoides]|uniref:Uncharacterized protein n=1 Tax=Sporocytophaga myxococcoides TaxID=153721 RepID=A0A098LIC2_9BACT|nr:hypothetical protein MYP_3017 [Sporocytophaga myxococcoides]
MVGENILRKREIFQVVIKLNIKTKDFDRIYVYKSSLVALFLKDELKKYVFISFCKRESLTELINMFNQYL